MIYLGLGILGGIALCGAPNLAAGVLIGWAVCYWVNFFIEWEQDVNAHH